MAKTKWHIPCTPGGTLLLHLAAKTEEKAWKNLYRDMQGVFSVHGFNWDLKERGYEICTSEHEKGEFNPKDYL